MVNNELFEQAKKDIEEIITSGKYSLEEVLAYLYYKQVLIDRFFTVLMEVVEDGNDTSSD
ncbi:hypothetical protein E308F_30480 [Moorella sp. E308F]|uniref:hypothetical protein n=1 Tax=Moorella sp. E308F TaxID=2572682 RepID=UPI0010FFC455|nr:hypothetical protein [Moorella sp. E308F]GEA16802.1 hypothetical protein E308F_30480 [Moorella sp. E308F]